MLDLTYLEALRHRIKATLSPEQWEMVQSLLWLTEEDWNQEFFSEQDRIYQELANRLPLTPILETLDQIVVTMGQPVN